MEKMQNSRGIISYFTYYEIVHTTYPISSIDSINAKYMISQKLIFIKIIETCLRRVYIEIAQDNLILGIYVM
jgi:hypothetical protein